MRSDEVDAGPWPAPPLVVNIAGTCDSRGKIARRALIGLPIGPDMIAILVVPFGPAGRKTADLIAARSDIPGFGHELDLAEHRILTDGVEESAALVEARLLARENGAEIEAETIDLHRLGPVAQRIRHHLDDARMARIDRIARARIVDIESV